LEHIFRALTEIDPSQLADAKLFDFRGLDADSGPVGRWLMQDPPEPSD
jgi:hypothetical protein